MIPATQTAKMARLFLLFIFSLYSFKGISQTELQKADSTVKAPFVVPSILIDYGKLLTIASDFETKYEGGIELLFKGKYALLIEAGNATLTPEGAYANGSYESTGVYYRFGGGYYVQRTPKNGLGIYALYGLSSFDELGVFRYQSPSATQPDFISDRIERSNLSANWWELVLYTDQSINDFMKLGLSLRYRQLISYDEFAPIDVYAIPGYGKSFDNSIPAANLILKVTF